MTRTTKAGYVFCVVFAILALCAAMCTYGDDLSDLDPNRPTNSEDVSSHAAYLRALHLAMRTFGQEEHSDEGYHQIPIGTKSEMLAADKENGRLWFATDPPSTLYIYRTTCDCWSPVAVFDPDEDVFMYKSEYDTDADSYVDNAEALYDGTNNSSALEVRSHLDDTANPHDVGGDDVNFTLTTLTTPAALKDMTSYEINDLVRVPAGGDYGAYLIPINGTDTVGGFVDAANNKGATIIPWPNNSDALSDATGKYVGDIVDGGYDMALLLDDIVLKGAPWYDARAYGATPGDDTDDDAGSIESAAAAAAAAGGGVVYLAPGVFHLKTSLDIDESNVVLCGAGIEATTLYHHADAGVNPTINVAGSTGHTEDIDLRDFTVDNDTAVAGYGIRVGSATYLASNVTIDNVYIENFDSAVGLQFYNAKAVLLKDMIFYNCDTAELIDYTIGSTVEANTAITHVHCQYRSSTTVGTQIDDGSGVSFIGCEWTDNEAEAVILDLDSSANTQTLLFEGCRFYDNITAASGLAYQVDIQSDNSRPDAYVTFNSCHFEDAVSGDNRGRHINIEDDMNLAVSGCHFNDPGPNDAILKVVGTLADDCVLVLAENFHRQAWAMDDTCFVQAPNANGYAKRETMVTNLYTGDPSDIDNEGCLVGDRAYATGTLLAKGGEMGWVCTQAGSNEGIDLGAHCSTAAGASTFTVDTAYIDELKIGDVLYFASVTTWDTAPYPVVRDIQVSGTTATVTVDQANGSGLPHVNTTAVDPAPVWSPMAMVPIHHIESSVTVGAISDDDIATGSITVTGASQGNYVVGAVDWTGYAGGEDPRDYLFSFQVTGADTVGWTVVNKSGAAITNELDGQDWDIVVWTYGTEY